LEQATFKTLQSMLSCADPASDDVGKLAWVGEEFGVAGKPFAGSSHASTLGLANFGALADAAKDLIFSVSRTAIWPDLSGPSSRDSKTSLVCGGSMFTQFWRWTLPKGFA
jgi:hypothetical protein